MRVEKKPVEGFRRVKNAYTNCPVPDEVLNWCTDKNSELNSPKHIQQALFKLDALAVGWPKIDLLESRVGQNHPTLVRKLLGLDFDNRRYRLRVAVARAYMATWRYADHFCDWRDAIKNSKKTLQAIEDFLTDWKSEIHFLADISERTGFHAPYAANELLPRSVATRFTNDMSNFFHSTNNWALSEAERARDFPKNPPRLFLYSRLCEIYACCSGIMPTGHASGKSRSRGLPPDKQLLSFLEPALTVVGFPTPESGSDNVLRDVAKYIVEYKSVMERLVGTHKLPIEYSSLPSVTLLVGLNCFSENEL